MRNRRKLWTREGLKGAWVLRLWSDRDRHFAKDYSVSEFPFFYFFETLWSLCDALFMLSLGCASPIIVRMVCRNHVYENLLSL